MSLLVNDLAIRIKNGYMARRDTIVARWSRTNEDIVALLQDEKYVLGFEVVEDGVKKDLIITLKYDKNTPAVTEVKLQSKPGRRVYRKHKDSKPVLGGLGIAVISTPSGLMTDKKARSLSIGGEVLFEIW